MKMKLSFHGASQCVTGSCYLLETKKLKMVIDCGMFQERQHEDRNWEPFGFDPSEVDVVLLTHAHLDHCGLLPKLVKNGFNGRIHSTPASAQIAKIIMEDSARIQMEDMKYKIKRLAKSGRKPKHGTTPLYDSKDAEAAAGLFSPIPAGQCIDLGGGVNACWFEAGHILGACSIMVTVEEGSERRQILFSGDIGRNNAPILEDPTTFEEADYILTESTYGNRNHEPVADIPTKFAEAINDAIKRGGNLVIPSFAVERTQDILYHLGNLQNAKRIPPVMTFVDSPMAVKVTEVFKENSQLWDAETMRQVREGRRPFDFRGLVMSRTVDQSKAINNIRGTAIIIAGSGMCTGGRVKHHLKNNIGRSEATILFVGYQAEGTLGRVIIEKAPEIRIFGEKYKVRAKISKINGFSGHADRDEMLKWISCIKNKPRKVFVTHGDKTVAFEYAQYVESKTGFDTYVPAWQETVELD